MANTTTLAHKEFISKSFKCSYLGSLKWNGLSANFYFSSGAMKLIKYKLLNSTYSFSLGSVINESLVSIKMSV